jgi:hypothetical protein
MKFPAYVSLYKFDLALMVFAIKGVKAGKREQHPK